METPAPAVTASLLGALLTYVSGTDSERPEVSGEILIAVQEARASLPALTGGSALRIASLVKQLHQAVFDPNQLPAESLEAALEPARALTRALNEHRAPVVQGMPEGQVAVFAKPAARHAQDAESLESRMMVMILLAVLCISGLAALGVWVSVSPPTQWPGPAIVTVSLGLAAVAFGWNARRLDVEAQELRRVSRQLEMLHPFVADLPDTAQGLLRGVLIQRLFPRLISDSDPLREAEWAPKSRELLIALDRAFLETEGEEECEDSESEPEEQPTPESASASGLVQSVSDPADLP